MQLTECVERYLATRETTTKYAKDIRRYCAALEMWHGQPLDVTDLHDHMLNLFLAALQEHGNLAAKTRAHYRAGIITAWRFAVTMGWSDKPPVHIRRVKVPVTLPDAWSLDDMRALVAACRKLRSTVRMRKGRHIVPSDVSRALLGEAIIQVLWSTGLRLGDALALSWDQVGAEGQLTLVQSKTAYPHHVALSPRALWLVRHLRGSHSTDKILPVPCSRPELDRLLAQVRNMANIERGLTREIRRSAASYVELHHPGHASRFLGHKTPGLAQKHYLDPRIVRKEAVRPPEL